MPGRKSVIAIDVDRERLGVAEAMVGDRSVTVKSWLSLVRPESVNFEDAGSVGRWLRGELDRAEVRATRAILAMPRGDVVLKRLSLAGAAAAKPAELGGMVRLQMSRQLTMPPEDAAIDHTAPMREAAGAGADAAVQAMSVMAGAMPGERVRWCREVCESAGLKLDRIGLRCYGAAGLLADLSQRRPGALLGVCAGASSVEFVVVEEGQLEFARAIDAPRAQADPETPGYAERVGVEAKRTWMSYRSTRGGGDAEHVVVLGADEAARHLAQQCGAQLERPWELATPPGQVETLASVPPADIPSMHALVGLLLEDVGERRTLDFANPRRAPDPGAARRRNLLLATLGVILVAGGSGVVGKRSLDGYAAQLDQARTREAELRSKLDDLLAQHARLSHVEQWQRARIDWLGYLGVINEQLPEPGQALLDGLDGRLDAEVQYTPKSTRYPDGTWAVRQSATFSIDGRAAGRSVAADLRGRLLDLPFDSVESKGPDVPDRFQYQLTTSTQVPLRAAPLVGPPAPPKPDAKAPKAGAPAAQPESGKGGPS